MLEVFSVHTIQCTSKRFNNIRPKHSFRMVGTEGVIIRLGLGVSTNDGDNL